MTHGSFETDAHARTPRIGAHACDAQMRTVYGRGVGSFCDSPAEGHFGALCQVRVAIEGPGADVGWRKRAVH